jgi:hypothetical protein
MTAEDLERHIAAHGPRDLHTHKRLSDHRDQSDLPAPVNPRRKRPVTVGSRTSALAAAVAALVLLATLPGAPAAAAGCLGGDSNTDLALMRGAL